MAHERQHDGPVAPAIAELDQSRPGLEAEVGELVLAESRSNSSVLVGDERGTRDRPVPVAVREGRPLLQPGRELGGGERLAEAVALREVAVELLEVIPGLRQSPRPRPAHLEAEVPGEIDG